MNCECMNKLIEELSDKDYKAYCTHAEALDKKPYLDFKFVDQKAGIVNKSDTKVSVRFNFCPMCGTRYRFRTDEQIANWQQYKHQLAEEEQYV